MATSNSVRKTIDEKSCNIDLVTETDQQVEKLLVDGIKSKFPDHLFIGEEDSSDGKRHTLTDEPTWIIDPIDGTMNFVHSFPHSAISVALLVKKVKTFSFSSSNISRIYHYRLQKSESFITQYWDKSIQHVVVKELFIMASKFMSLGKRILIQLY